MPDHEPIPRADDQRRTQFLLEMYKEMWGNINRHILVVWQSVAVLASTVAVFALTEKDILSLDMATALGVLIPTWLFAHLSDANYWYNRNLAIIANIERQFLRPEDLCHIHWYFRLPRKPGKLLDHLRIQGFLGSAILALILINHFYVRVLPGLGRPISNFEFMRSLPYLVSAVALIALWIFGRRQEEEYQKFLQRSPGVEVNVSHIACGVHISHSWFEQTKDAGSKAAGELKQE